MVYVVLLFLHKYPGEGKDHFQAKPCQSICPERHLTARVFGKHGLGSLIPPRYMLCLCICGLSSREKSTAPTCSLPTSSGLQRRNIELSGVWYLSPPDSSLCCDRRREFVRIPCASLQDMVSLSPSR